MDGELVGARRALVREHMVVCPECRYDVMLLLSVRTALVRRVTSLPPLAPAHRTRLEDYLPHGLG